MNNQSIETQSFDFKKNKRLITALDYKFVFDNVDFKIHQPNLFCLVLLQENNPQLAEAYNHSRLGLAISKAKNKHAHERNRVKRVIREYFRLNQHTLIKPVDMVFMTKKNTSQVTNNQLFLELENAFKKINYKTKNL